jgi:hypothetical protein
VINTLEISTTWNLVLQLYQVRLWHETLSVLRHSMLQDFAMDCVVQSIDQQLLCPDEFNRHVALFLTMHYHIGVQTGFHFAE